MPVSTIQLILIIISLIIMLVGLTILYRGLRKSIDEEQALEFQDSQIIEITPEQEAAVEYVEHGKNGIPIIPRHQRPHVDETFKAEITPSNPTGSVILSGENTELDLSHHQNTQETTVLTSPEPIMAHESTHTTITQTNNIASQTTQDSDDAFSMLANAAEMITPVVHTFDERKLKKEVFVENSPILDTHIQAQVMQEQNSPLNNATQNINISIFPNQHSERFSGRNILALVDKYGMKYGAMNMFHRYENKDGTGLLWFSMMMITDDGILPFDLNKLPTQFMKGLVLFLSLPHPKASQGFDSMMSVAGLMAHDLQGGVYDDAGIPINKENTQIMREIAVSFNQK